MCVCVCVEGEWMRVKDISGINTVTTKMTQGKKAQEKWGDKEKPGGELGLFLALRASCR